MWLTAYAAALASLAWAASAQVLSALPEAPSALIVSSTTSSTFTEFSSTRSEAQAFTQVPERSAPAGFPSSPNTHEQHVRSEIERNTNCEEHVLRGKPCRVSWPRVLAESFFFLSAQHGGNIALDKDTRAQVTGGNFWANYVYCVEHYRFNRWKDDDPFGVDYVGHPMMGAMTNSIYEQNDPKQRALMFENTRRYWMGRLRATAYSAAYSAQWKLGPLSEASIGNTGIGYYIRPRDGIWTNETGMQDFFITPIGGLAWNVGEDVIDKFIFSHIRHARRNRPLLVLASTMTPLKSGANVARFRAPYYRDFDESTAGLLHWKRD